MSDWSNESRELFGRVTSAKSTAEDRARVRAKIDAEIAAKGLSGGVAKVTRKLWWAVAGAVVIGVGAFFLSSAKTSEELPPSGAVRPPAVEASAGVPVAPIASTVTVSADSSTHVASTPVPKPSEPKVSGPKATGADDSAAELALMRRIRSALDAGSMAEARSLADEHRARFPAGLFVEEREGARAIASCVLDANAGKPQAMQFLRRHSSSPMAQRVRASCKLDAP